VVLNIKTVRDFIDDDTRNNLADRVDAHDYEMAALLRDPMRESFYRSWKVNDFEFSDPLKRDKPNKISRKELSRIDPVFDLENEYNYIWEIKRYLATYQNFVNLNDDFGMVKTRHPVVDSIEKQIHLEPWSLKESLSKTNFWCMKDLKRKTDYLPTYELRNWETNSVGQFHLQNFDDDKLITVLWFNIEDRSKRGKAFHTIKEFKRFAEFIMLNNSETVNGFLSRPAAWDENNERVIDPWRFEDYADENLEYQSRLGRFWCSLGGVMGGDGFDVDDPERLYFFSAEKALEAKEVFEKHDRPNPYRAAARTIYDSDTERILKSS